VRTTVSDRQGFSKFIAPKVAKQYTNYEQAISITQRLAISLKIRSDLLKCNREKLKWWKCFFQANM